jgi:hypothetical protein
VLGRQLAYWAERLAGAPPALNLPTDRPRPPAQTYRGARHPFRLPGVLAAALRRLGRQENCTPFMVLLAAFQALLYRYSGQEDLCVGTPIAGRNRAETEGLIGFFVNTLVLRTDLSGAPPFRALLTAYLEDRPVYVFDEWASDQDPRFKEVFYRQLLPELKARGKAVLVISHDERYFHVADRVVKLDYGTLQEVRPAHARIPCN